MQRAEAIHVVAPALGLFAGATRVGGGYRFSHRLLQEHVAEREASALPVAPILGPQKGDVAAGRRARG